MERAESHNPPMIERLTRENLHGVWAAIATPFDEHDRFDEAIFRENIRRVHAAGVHGIYTTDAEGRLTYVNPQAERLLGRAPDLGTVRAMLADQFGAVFGRTVRPAPTALWELIGSWGLLDASSPAKSEIRPIYS